ncbi:MAG TPA: helix-turn-helix transcriptional regulator [Candidatus Sulfotelmatobacter sp.]|nr:helix-turn-helix transcriptional regulator [Candidatus Sulfotelmatobacter sp.]
MIFEEAGEEKAIDMEQVKVTPRDQQVLNLLVQGCSNNRDSRATQHPPPNREATPAHAVLARRYPRGPQAREAGHCHVLQGGRSVMTPRERLTAKEIQIAILVWEGLTNREIGKIVGTSEQVIRNHLRSAFDKLGVWSRLELAMYVASHGGKDWPPEAERPGMP